jgi:hypothetical protein
MLAMIRLNRSIATMLRDPGEGQSPAQTRRDCSRATLLWLGCSRATLLQTHNTHSHHPESAWNRFCAGSSPSSNSASTASAARSTANSTSLRSVAENRFSTKSAGS